MAFLAGSASYLIKQENMTIYLLKCRVKMAVKNEGTQKETRGMINYIRN